MVPAAHSQLRVSTGRVIRVPSRGILRGSGQEVSEMAREVSGMAIRANMAITAIQASSSFSMVNMARVGVVTAIRAVGCRVREGENLRGNVSYVESMATNARSVLRGTGPHSSSSRVLVRSRKDRVSHRPPSTTIDASTATYPSSPSSVGTASVRSSLPASAGCSPTESTHD